MGNTQIKKSVMNINEPVIYAICDEITDNVVYIGQTKNPKKRANNYLYPNSCHNVGLKKWLTTNGWYFKILEKNPPDLNGAEKKWIAEYKESLLNLNHGGEWNWREHNRLPWMAGKMVLCPSDLLLTTLRNHKYPNYSKIKEDLTNIRKTMTVKERVVFEVGLAMDWYDTRKELIDKWLSYTQERLVLCLSQ
jgi:hypothetical protein